MQEWYCIEIYAFQNLLGLSLRIWINLNERSKILFRSRNPFQFFFLKKFFERSSYLVERNLWRNIKNVSPFSVRSCLSQVLLGLVDRFRVASKSPTTSLRSRAGDSCVHPPRLSWLVKEDDVAPFVPASCGIFGSSASIPTRAGLT